MNNNMKFEDVALDAVHRAAFSVRKTLGVTSCSAHTDLSTNEAEIIFETKRGRTYVLKLMDYKEEE